MDRKTLQYMEERSKKAREIVNAIELLNKQIQLSKKTYAFEFYTPSHSIREGTSKKQLSEFEAHLLASIVNTFIDVSEKEIQRLEQELAEL